MVNTLSYPAVIFDSIGVLSSFSVTETVWNTYEKFALQKIKDSTFILRGSLYYLRNLTQREASEVFKSIFPLIPALSELRMLIEHLENKEFNEFRHAALEFFETVDLLFRNLQDITDLHSSYESSGDILAEDWDSTIDEHWNNY